LGWLVNPAPSIQLLEDQWESICENVEQTGFYSVWVTVFKQYDHNLAQELVTRLNNRANADPNNFNRYHGTNINNSVVPYIPQL
jgi:glutamate 5-kinase